MRVEEIALRQEIRQLLNEAGFNKNTLKDLVKGALKEELNKATKQAVEETNIVGYTIKNIDSIINKATERVVREKITDTIVGNYFKQMTVDVNVNPIMSYKAERESKEYQKRYTPEEVGKILTTEAQKHDRDHGLKWGGIVHFTPSEVVYILKVGNSEASDMATNTLEQEPKTGHWINAYPDIEPNPMFIYGICSVCGFEQSISNKLNYCPNCRTKMVEPQESEDKK
jgi:hypothetical protein